MTIIELVVAFAVLMAVLVPVSLLLTNVLSQGATSKDRLTALSLAEQCIETLNNKGPTLTDGVPEADVSILEDTNCLKSTTATVPTATRKPDVVSTISYNLYAEFRWSTEEGTHPDLCKAGLVPAVIDAQVTVTWPHTQTVTDTTVLDYPPPGLPTDGFLAVQLNGTPKTDEPADAKGRSWSTRVQAVPVKIADTRPTKYTHTLHPNGYGCIFVEVPPGTYSIKASDPSTDGYGTPSWVANQNEATSATVTGEVVSVGNVTGPVTIPYDEGSVVSVSYPSTTATDGTVVCPNRGTILCLELGQTPSTSAKPAKTPAAELSILSTASGTKKWSVSKPAGVTWLASAACAGTRQCIIVGYDKSGSSYVGVALSSGTASTPGFVADTLPSGTPTTALSGITCPTTTTCYAYGLESTGAAILTGTVSTSGVTWKADSFATQPARITSIACYSKTSCYAIATKSASTTPVVLSLGTSTKWTTDTLPTSTTTVPTKLTAIACPGTKVCYAVGTRKKATSASWISLTRSTLKKWVNDSLPSTVKVLTRLVCPSTSTCYATGTHKVSSTVYGVIVSLVTSTLSVDTPTTETTIGTITCPTTTACVAIGTSSSTPIVLSQTGSTTFTSETPSGILLLSGLSCVTSTTSHCYIVGESSTTGDAVILSGLTSWTTDTLHSTPAAVQISSIACGGSVCAAPGASETGAVYLDGTPTGTSWTNATPSGATGMYMSGEPVAVTNSGLETTRPLDVKVPNSTAAVASTGPLFPFETGYFVAATVCKSMSPTTTATSVPGATDKVALPMGLLSIKVVNKYGNPDTSATITAKPTCTPKIVTTPSSFTLEPTGPLGSSQLAVTYGSYTITVKTKAGTYSKSYTVVVGASSLTVTGVTKPISTPVQVATLT